MRTWGGRGDLGSRKGLGFRVYGLQSGGASRLIMGRAGDIILGLFSVFPNSRLQWG